MKKMVKLVFSILGIIFVIYFLNVMVSSFFIGGKVFFPINYERAEKRFQQDKERMLVVSEYFSISEYKKIYIPISMESNMMSVDGKNKKTGGRFYCLGEI